MSAIAIIPARGGSLRIARKNVRLFDGKPIIVYSIEAAQYSGEFDTVAVSTDDTEVARLAMSKGCTVLWRPEKLCDDVAGTDAVMAYHMEQLPVFELACCIYATAPLMSHYDLQEGHRLLRAEPEKHYCFSMGIDPNKDAAQWYWGWRSSWTQRKHFVTQHSIIYPIKADRHCDINTEEDWARAEAMFEALQQ